MINKTNPWSCVLDSFAFASGIPSDTLIGIIGHEGDLIGFHTQELIEVMVWSGRSVTEIQRFPQAIHPFTLKQRNINFEGSGGREHRFARHLYHTCGVLLGTNSSDLPHAVAWLDNHTHDSATGKSSTLLLRNSQGYLTGVDNEHPFSPTIFLRISRTQ